MKKLIGILALALTLALSLSMFGCDGVFEEETEKTVGVIVIVDEEEKIYEATGNFATVYDVLSELCTVYAEEYFSFSVTNSSYGAFITEINGYKQDDAAYKYWVYYTDCPREEGGVVNYYEEYTFVRGEVTFFSCMSGVSGQKVQDGETFLFTLT